MLAFDESDKSPATIRVVGVGGAGMNAIERMATLNLHGVDLIAVNTDEQVLRKSSIPNKIHLGNKITKGMGAGARPEIGEKAAIEDRDRILNVLKGSDMVFITAGMGGGTGTGASPVIAEVAHEIESLVVGVVSMPFKAEGVQKQEIAKKGKAKLKERIDTLITIPNDFIFKVVDRKTPINIAFKAIDDILARSVIGISDIINSAGYVNVDFADVKTVMSQNGDAIIGVGEGHGESKIADAMQNAIRHPLLEGKQIDGATSVLINVVGSSDFSMYEYNEILETMHKQVSKNAQIIIGFREDAVNDEMISITVIATGFRPSHAMKETYNENGQGIPQEKQENNIAANNIRIDQYNEIQEQEQKTGTYDSSQGNLYPPPKQDTVNQQNLNFPHINTNHKNYNIPAFLRKKK